jgi:glycosyltransferase involved in cell wall biosynthesis
MISCIVPAYNTELFIGAALESILSQNFEDLEIIVVDDGSMDRTAEICAGFPSTVRCISQENAGLPAARNRGLQYSRGDFITFLDADDVYVTGSLILQLKKLMLNPAVDLVVGRFLNEEISSVPGEPMAFVPVDTPDDIVLSMGVSLIRRHVFEIVGMFDESLRYCDDWDWFMRAREMQVPMLFHRETVMRRRLHHDNMTRDREIGNAYMAMMLKRSIERRRNRFGKANSLASLSTSLEPFENKGPI